ncbi:uncharacterized protein KY384_008374 [Bacidia gigantensis]|uniref:uncharacterized protein n=1 Tax=Bacidia gigantensis TaxID=2732470 RepID=UPI001D04F256|nr:uncharacterized protein KY384_008374 [Bacidia gigantensis]KAG8526945.1 hypothetical protein KY384_008374 [Bacidia gigantensis]
MAETNNPKDSVNNDSTRGLPYYEKLRKDLRETLQKKRLLDKNMAAIEDQIYRYESSYLEETSAGNIIKGFDNYIKGTSTAPTASSANNVGTSSRRKGGTMDADRIFSRSSVSFMREVSPGPSDSGRETPRTEEPTGGNKNKKKKSSAGNTDGDEDEIKGPKRLKITYARGGEGD